MRYFLDIAYRGTAFHGWQIQPNAVTVQEEIQRALSVIFQQPMECVGSGRTDTGVHATHQIAHVDWESKLSQEDVQYKLNGLLPPEIAINEVMAVKPEAHARFDAEKRTYHYHIHKHKDPFRKGLSYHFGRSLDMEAIASACGVIARWKNFQAFSKVHTDVNHFDCDIFHIEWKETNEGYVFSVSANRFLRGMVRAMVGTLLDIGQGRMTLEAFEDALKSGVRSNVGRAAPPEGLYLTEVLYPKSVYLDT
ncbi:tRNA pseudouridine(38-40) synthase TruA [Marinoscillum furvescens]|uniref:tRNA pseudouridine synthase A n=1 Tax=Marinoscillum furvescens DSM 4134 TaxID=1122208 RepID=A0A3D9L4Y3_MARFU|nr:tRNA pseudouridine(38-40) synthase TruA [Marinoscillum furvescens]REE00579.1 tRNA pseudouridine(38-40) synthase [Marinoscillum furvescens DSM 4134]